MRAPKAEWQLSYENRDVTDELATTVTAVRYTDYLGSKADELELSIVDLDGRWRGGWFPSTGDRIVARVGPEGGPLLHCGSHQVDSVDLSGPPDTVSVRAIAAPAVRSTRTAQSRSFSYTTLADVVATLARELSLEVVGDVRSLPLVQVSQASETTTAFLKRLAEEHGYTFSIRNGKLVFYEIAALEAARPALALRRTDLDHYRFEAKAQGTYVACRVDYFDVHEKVNRTEVVYQDHARERVVVGGTSSTGGTPALPSRTLRVGSSGDDVRRWQTFLTAQGHDPGPIDGAFGPKTRAGTISFQRAASIGVDGVAGPETYRAALETGWGSTAAIGTRTEPAGPVLRKTIRAESREHARVQAAALLAQANRLRVSGVLGFPGRIAAVAGATIELLDMGRLSGTYLVQVSRHQADGAAAYTTEVEVTRAPDPPAPSGGSGGGSSGAATDVRRPRVLEAV